MPKATKQSNKGEPLPSKGILSRGKSVKELKTNYIKMVVYGQNRTGKTTLACSFPKPLALIACEPGIGGGAISVSSMDGVTIYHVTTPETKEDLLSNDPNYPAVTLDEVEILIEEIKDSKHFKTLAVDSVTSLQDLVLYEIVGEIALGQLDWGVISQDQYRQRASRTKEYLKLFLDVPCHVVCTAKEKDHNPPQDERNKLTRGLQIESCFATDLGGNTAGWLHDKCDYIGRLYSAREIKQEEVELKTSSGVKKKIREVDTGRTIRRLLTMLHPNYVAGFRSPVPDNIPEYIDNPTFEKLEKVIKGERIKDAYYPQDERE